MTTEEALNVIDEGTQAAEAREHYESEAEKAKQRQWRARETLRDAANKAGYGRKDYKDLVRKQTRHLSFSRLPPEEGAPWYDRESVTDGNRSVVLPGAYRSAIEELVTLYLFFECGLDLRTAIAGAKV